MVGPFQAELRAHCYRMTASMSDAEDALQEALLRAWRGLDKFEGRASLRTWLYKIATNVCLDFVKQRQRRTVPSELEAASAPDQALPPPILEPIWLEPCPEETWQTDVVGPDARYSARESVGIAFLVALQELPPLQRAVLVLRDVLGFSAEEVAELLDVSTAAVNSALQRARATTDERKEAVNRRNRTLPSDEYVRQMLARYVAAWETSDPSFLVDALQEDAILRMPPIPTWYHGKKDILAFMNGMFRTVGECRLLPTVANGAPALALYVADESGVLRAHSLHVFDIAPDGIVAVDAFLDPAHLTRFGFAPVLDRA